MADKALVAGCADLHPVGAAGRVGAPARPGSGARPAVRHDLPLWHKYPRAPGSGRGGQERDAPAQRDHLEAPGRGRGGFGTKACVLAASLGRAVAFVLARGQAHERPHPAPLLDQVPQVPEWVVADQGYTSHAFREHIRDLGAQPAIPTQRHEASVACPDWIYVHRNQVERALGQAQGMASRRDTLRENRPIIHGRALPRRHVRLAQKLAGPRRLRAHSEASFHFFELSLDAFQFPRTASSP